MGYLPNPQCQGLPRWVHRDLPRARSARLARVAPRARGSLLCTTWTSHLGTQSQGNHVKPGIQFSLSEGVHFRKSLDSDNRSVLYQRIPRMFADLALARGDGRYPRLMRALGGVKLLILDDCGLEPLGPEQRHDVLEIVEDRYGRGATLITSQIPVDRWHDLIGEPTLADAILDRIVHNAHRLQLNGDSLRKKAAKIAAA